MTLETLLTFLTIENNNMNNYIKTFEYRVMVTAYAILPMFCMAISKVLSFSELVSESVTRSPIELFWTAKKPFMSILYANIPLKSYKICPKNFEHEAASCHISFIICLSCPQPAQVKQVLQTTDCVCVAEEMSRVLSFEDAFKCLEKK